MIGRQQGFQIITCRVRGRAYDFCRCLAELFIFKRAGKLGGNHHVHTIHSFNHISL